MKKYISLNLLLFSLFLLGSIMTTVILYKDIDNPFSTKFIVGYVIYLILYCLLSISFVIANLRKLKGKQVRKRILTFAMLFIPLSISHFLLYEYVAGSETEMWDLGIPFGVSVGLAFSDLMSWKEKDSDVVG